MHVTISLASNVTNELVALWCIMERVKRLAGNEIELGMKIPTIESRDTDDKGNDVCCHYGLTDKDLWRICRNQYEHPDSAIGYWPEMCLGHVYIVLEPVGSARLTSMTICIMSYVIWWPKFVRSPGWDHGHDEESRNGWEVKIDILDEGIRTPEWFRKGSNIFRSTGGYRNPPGELMGLHGP